MKLFVAYDGSKHADAAIADLKNAGLPAVGEAQVATVGYEDQCAEKGAVQVQEALPGWKITHETLMGEAPDVIKRAIDQEQPDLLLVGSHGRSAAGRIVLGSVSLDLVHHARCAIRVVRADAPKVGRHLRVLVATDGSPQSEAAIHSVATRSWPEDAQMRVVAVVQTLVPPIPALVPALEGGTFATEAAYQVIDAADERQRRKLNEAAEKAVKTLEHAGLEAGMLVLDGDPRTEIVAEAQRWHADSIFIGARGLGALDRLLLGSVSSAVVTHAHCAVEVVR